MKASAVVGAARDAGVRLAVGPNGALKAIGPRDAVARWSPAVKAHKAAILELLARHDAAPVEEWEERAAHLEYDAGLPRSWAEPFARILCGEPPGDFSPGHWQAVVDGGLRFADQWAAKALAMGWRPEDVFGLHANSPAARRDCKGLAWLLGDGERIVGIDANGADIAMPSGSRQRFYRQRT
jgi:hypothetical protein